MELDGGYSKALHSVNHATQAVYLAGVFSSVTRTSTFQVVGLPPAPAST